MKPCILYLAIAGGLAIVVIWRLDQVALALVAGVFVGALASIPPALLVLGSIERRMKREAP